MSLKKYLPAEFESKWTDRWDKEKTYKTGKISDLSNKIYTLSMFPYPSGVGLHVGHARIYTGTDVLARYWRMKGLAVLNAMGWDAFGLPAENAAIKAKKNPMDMVPKNIENFKRQMKVLGFSFDWGRELTTTDPDYYKWTQWLFLQLYKIRNKQGLRLVYRADSAINWCPFCKTGLANEEVLADGKHERCGRLTVEKRLPQWMMRITDYVDRLLGDLTGLDWPAGILQMQRNWIGKKEGVIIPHKVEGVENYTLDTFSVYPTWSFADSFIVVAPEHPLVEKIKNQISNSKKTNQKSKLVANFDKTEKYLQEIEKIPPKERAANKEKTGVFTGFYAIDPFRPGQKMPIWIANFALMDIGTGAIRCSGHDARDVEFAKKYDISLRWVVDAEDGGFVNAHDNKGILQDSGPFTGREVGKIQEEFVDWMEKANIGKRHVSYHLRDWIFSRQRYWGEPFPLVYCDKCGDENGVVPVPETDLPVKLPYLKSYEPTDTGESPLSKIKEWVNVVCPKCGQPARRETDTMPNWAGSCWYFIRFAQNQISNIKYQKDNKLLANQSYNLTDEWKSLQKKFQTNWLPVDWYLGGAEHAVLHLLYARFWVKALQDLGLINISEPFTRLRNVGMVLAEDGRKMSKSLGNVVNPDEVVAEYGSDTLRVYEMFMAPFAHEVAWSTRAVGGAHRFLTRIWQIYQNPAYITDSEKEEDKILVAELQKLIIKVSSDIANVKFNTAIAALMTFLNSWEEPKKENEKLKIKNKNDKSKAKIRKLSKSNAKKFIKLLAPFAPFISEQIWLEALGEHGSIHLSDWPEMEAKAMLVEKLKIPVQVNGKVREVLLVDPSVVSKEAVVKLALASQRIGKWVKGQPHQAIYVPGKILNLVIKKSS